MTLLHLGSIRAQLPGPTRTMREGRAERRTRGPQFFQTPLTQAAGPALVGNAQPQFNRGWRSHPTGRTPTAPLTPEAAPKPAAGRRARPPCGIHQPLLPACCFLSSSRRRSPPDPCLLWDPRIRAAGIAGNPLKSPPKWVNLVIRLYISRGTQTGATQKEILPTHVTSGVQKGTTGITHFRKWSNSFEKHQRLAAAFLQMLLLGRWANFDSG